MGGGWGGVRGGATIEFYIQEFSDTLGYKTFFKETCFLFE